MSTKTSIAVSSVVSAPISRRQAVQTAAAAVALAGGFLGATAFGADAGKADRKSWKQTKSPLIQSDYPYQKACIGAKFPANNKANKGIAMIVGPEAFMCFDTDLLRMSAGWTSGMAQGKGGATLAGFITSKGVTFDGSHGGHPEIAGEQKFGLRQQPGWADKDGSFKDPRKEPYGPLPRTWCRWDGMYTVGNDLVLAYTVHGTKILEQPGSVEKGGETGFVRTFKTEATKSALTMAVCEVEGATAKVEGARATLTANDLVTIAALVGAPDGLKLVVIDGNRLVLNIPANTPASLFKLVLWRGAASAVDKFAALLEGKPALVDYAKGGPRHWPEAVETKGVLASSTTPDGAYVTDTLTPPVPNPWNRRVRFGGLDFFSDGKRAALSTWDGDVWIVSGIDDKLEKLTWTRFASGGFETLGLKIVDDVIYTTGRDQITRYVDLNNDGEADYYENFNNEITSSPGFHEFVFDLHTDSEGNFYTAKAGPVKGGGRGFGGGGGNGEISAHAGCVLKIDKYGEKLSVHATGVRAPNGIGVSPDGQVTTGDNEGTWVPMCPINWVKPGGFLGVEDLAHGKDVKTFTQPLCWLPKSWDNSGGGQAWVTSDKWGPFKGELLHTSYGQSSLYLVLKEEVNGQMQGGVVKFPLKFTSSAMRPRFNPVDGQLYNAGLRGWQSNAAKEGGLDRIRYTGKPVQMVSGLKVTKGAVALTFSAPLDKASAEDLQNYTGERWNYKRTSNYGSPEFTVADPEKKGHDKLELKSAKLSADGKTVTLEIAGLKPVMQQSLSFRNLKTADGAALSAQVMHTINAIP